jgi:glycosyltransferase involved in cell wall biosynthesis
MTPMADASPAKTVVMFTPAADCGHARYTMELMRGLHEHPGREFKYELVSSENLEDQFRNVSYVVHPILPALRHRDSYSSRFGWILGRLLHYPLREMRFLKWLRNRPDVVAVHIQEWKPWMARFFIRALQRMGKKVFFTVHNVYPHRYPAYIPKWLMDRWVRRASLACDGLFVLSDLLAEELGRFLGTKHPPIHVSPHGVWTVPDAKNLPTIEERLSWKKLLFFGSIRINKGLDLLLRAADQLQGYKITIAGEPWDDDYFKAEILPRIERLRAMGMEIDLQAKFISDDQVGPLFSSHSAIVLPYTKGFVAQSGVMYMAMAYELPAVASEAGGLRDLFREAKVGLTFKDYTPESLAAAVKSLDDPAVRQELVNGIRAGKRRFSWHEAARATISLYSATESGRREVDDCAITPAPAN